MGKPTASAGVAVEKCLWAQPDDLGDARWTYVVNKKKKDGKVCQLEEIAIPQVMTKGWEPWGMSEISIDSTAEESERPRLWGDVFDLGEVQPDNEMKLRNAKGGTIVHFGQRDIMFEVEGGGAMLMNMGIQASDVRKPLAAAHRNVEKGNKVQ